MLFRSPTANSKYNPGAICDFRIYGRSLNENEVGSLYNKKRFPDEYSNLNIQFDMKEGSGNLIYDDRKQMQPLQGEFRGVLRDVSTFTGSVVGATWTSGNNLLYLENTGSALGFDGTNDYIGFGTQLGSNFMLDTPFSINCWLKTPGGANDVIISNQDIDAPNTGMQLYLVSSSGLRLDIISTLPALLRIDSGSISISDNTWHNIGLTYNGGSGAGIRWYFDGGSIATSANSNNTLTNLRSTTNLQFMGQDGTNFCLSGLLDEFRIYNTALTASQIAQLYSGIDITSNLVAHYSFNEGSGNFVYDQSGSPFLGQFRYQNDFTINA